MKVTHQITNITNTPFENKHIRKIIDRAINRLNIAMQQMPLICDPFARDSYLKENPNIITNDLNPDFECDYNMECNDFAEMLMDTFLNTSFEIDLLVFDPPYSLRQLKDHYDAIGKNLELWQTQNQWGRAKNAYAELMPVGSYAICLGWHSHGMGRKRGFDKVAVHYFEQAGHFDRYDLCVTVEQKTQATLYDYPEPEP